MYPRYVRPNKRIKNPQISLKSFLIRNGSTYGHIEDLEIDRNELFRVTDLLRPLNNRTNANKPLHLTVVAAVLPVLFLLLTMLKSVTVLAKTSAAVSTIVRSVTGDRCSMDI